MIDIATVELLEIRLKLKEPFRISSGVETERRILLLYLTDSDGTATWSECVAGAGPNYSPEAIDTAWIVLTNWVAPLILKQRFEDPRDIWRALTGPVRGNEMAKAAIEMGCWAVEALKQERSLSSLLGGTREMIPTGISIGIQDSPAILAQQTSEAVARGYRKVKVKIKPGRDIEFVKAARDAVGSHSLMADANNAYTLDDVGVFKELDKCKLTMVEQPLAWNDVRLHSKLQCQIETPICLDESITSLERAREMIELDSGKIINIKPGRVGGFSEAIAIHDLAVRSGIPVWCGGMLESGIGRAYNVALASLPGFSLPGDLSPSNRYWARDIVTPEWEMDSNGFVTVPTAPGIGVSVNRDRIDNLTVRRELL